MQTKMNLKDNLFNLALLPKADNISKSNKRLIEITNQWLKTQIIHYEEIDESDFVIYSDINNWDKLKENRGKLFKNVFDVKRKYWLNN